MKLFKLVACVIIINLILQKPMNAQKECQNVIKSAMIRLTVTLAVAMTAIDWQQTENHVTVSMEW